MNTDLYTRKKPKYGVMYTFRNRGEKEYFKLDEELPGERYSFINLKYGNNTVMTLKRFNYKWRHHSGKEKELEDIQFTIDETTKPVSRTSAAPKATVAPMQTSKLSTDKQIVQQLLRRLESLSERESDMFWAYEPKGRRVEYYIDILTSNNIPSYTLMIINSVFKKAGIVL